MSLRTATTFAKNLWPLLTILLVVTLCMIAAKQSVKLFPVPTPIPPVRGDHFIQKRTQMPSATEFAREIASHHLFGNANSEVAIIKVKPLEASLQRTRLDLQLTGVFASDPPEHASAVITVSGKDQTAYRIGETIDQQTILEAVFPDHVVLRNRGALEKLMLIGMQ